MGQAIQEQKTRLTREYDCVNGEVEKALGMVRLALRPLGTEDDSQSDAYFGVLEAETHLKKARAGLDRLGRLIEQLTVPDSFAGLPWRAEPR
jgi:hypothetical protein